jgi:adenine-specific DNA-methyltransferase
VAASSRLAAAVRRGHEFEYDPHLDPQLVWAGKAERTSFEVEAPSIHVHERMSAEDVIRSVEREPPELALFELAELDRSKAVEFYEHELGWENRLILGDSLVVMTSVLEKERLGGQVQVIYFDPPYGINFNSNFQARISNRSPKETQDEALTREPEQVQAYRDTWLLGVHSYLTHLRDRLLLCRELLAETGSIFVQIGPDRLHLVRNLLDEVFGAENACPVITVMKTSQVTSTLLPEVADFLLWYAKDRKQAESKYRHLFEVREEMGPAYRHVELPDGRRRPMTAEERADPSQLPEGSRIFRYDNVTSQGFSATKTVDRRAATRRSRTSSTSTRLAIPCPSGQPPAPRLSPRRRASTVVALKLRPLVAAARRRRAITDGGSLTVNTAARSGTATPHGSRSAART